MMAFGRLSCMGHIAKEEDKKKVKVKKVKK
jgi:hypothetical protein